MIRARGCGRFSKLAECCQSAKLVIWLYPVRFDELINCSVFSIEERSSIWRCNSFGRNVKYFHSVP